jgi:hypothetical protein
MRMNYRSISVWSMARLMVFNQMAPQERARNGNLGKTDGPRRFFGKAGGLFKSIWCLFQFALAVMRHGRAEVIIRVSSFSIAGQRQGRVLFINRNLQEIYDTLSRQNTGCMVVVNDLREYKLPQKITAAILYPPAISSLPSKAIHALNRTAVGQIVSGLSESIPLEPKELRNTVLYQLANFFIWSSVYKYVRPKMVYYESPHNAFEAEIVAAKKNNIRTIEIYHGTLSTKEPSYFQKHLDFDSLLHAVCHEYLSQSTDQTKIMADIGRYEKVTTVGYRSNLSLSLRQKMKLSRVRNRTANHRRKMLIIPSITDNDVQDIKKFIRANRRHLLRTFQEISLKLHPADSEARWQSLTRAYPFLHFSALPLGEDIVTSHALVVVSPTTILQLKALKIDFVDLSRRVI